MEYKKPQGKKLERRNAGFIYVLRLLKDFFPPQVKKHKMNHKTSLSPPPFFWPSCLQMIQTEWITRSIRRIYVSLEPACGREPRTVLKLVPYVSISLGFLVTSPLEFGAVAQG